MSHTILERKVDSISNDLRRTIDTLRVMTENLRIRKKNRAPPVHRARVSPMGVHGQMRARRHVQPAQFEFSESNDGGIQNQRHYDEDSHTDNDVEEWTTDSTGKSPTVESPSSSPESIPTKDIQPEPNPPPPCP
ncbi:hypothetical protein Ddye_028286 [Dipteronia dyeriana]|uniref:Uncharacterized protein n=1 Tax=Dipteronia dyeriana TaxID=168575 RepID=A0AAD9TRD7_9ROSI|nr:hypothetical protein Ddye_028286 [Dipteronia dyeriana]